MASCIKCGEIIGGDGPAEDQTRIDGNIHAAVCPGLEVEFVPTDDHGPACGCGWVTRGRFTSARYCGRRDTEALVEAELPSPAKFWAVVDAVRDEGTRTCLQVALRAAEDAADEARKDPGPFSRALAERTVARLNAMLAEAVAP